MDEPPVTEDTRWAIPGLGRTNSSAETELAALSERALQIAADLAAAVWPGWDTPARWRQRSTVLLPGR